MTDTPMTPDVAAVQQAATRAIHALKSPVPDGSQHYRSGWDDGLEAAMDAARDALEGPARVLLAEVDRLRAELARWRERTEEAETSEAQLKGRVRGLRAQVDELEAEREAGPTRDTPDAGTPRRTGLPLGLTGRARHDARVAMETARKTRRRAGACSACGDLPEQWCPDCAACRQGCHGGHDNNPCTHPNAPWNTEPTP
ncbi:hypothetical protein ABZ684_04820 [Streptomyces sp. NPDC006995]|uniref:PspA/IM30 family protein n=1 Tax=Streptomyces sp. NPDC006995 TaxID=3156907 RepID=UPI00340D8952